MRVSRRSPDSKDDVAGIVKKVVTYQQITFLNLFERKGSLEHFIKSDDLDSSEEKQIDMYGNGGISLNG